MIDHAERLEGIDERLLRIVRAIEDYPILAVEGLRSQDRQGYLYAIGRSWTRSGAHVAGRAMDLVPAHTRWADDGNLLMLAGLVIGAARAFDYPIRWGGDWDRDWKLNREHQWDAAHFELIDE